MVLVLTAGLCGAVALPAGATGGLDGEWRGMLIPQFAEAGHGCGMEGHTIIIVVSGNAFEARTEDLGRRRTITGNVAENGRIRHWIDGGWNWHLTRTDPALLSVDAKDNGLVGNISVNAARCHARFSLDKM